MTLTSSKLSKRLTIATSTPYATKPSTVLSSTRQEVQTVHEHLEKSSEKAGVLVTGEAGIGKSGVMLQVVEELLDSGIPVVALRADQLEVHPTARGRRQADRTARFSRQRPCRRGEGKALCPCHRPVGCSEPRLRPEYQSLRLRL